MNRNTGSSRDRYPSWRHSATLVLLGSVLGGVISYAFASTPYPEAHKGLKVEVLGHVPADSMQSQIGLEGHILLLRKITIAPGGQIARHSAASVPGVVVMASGTWIEGRDSGEVAHTAGDVFIEDKDTVHWFYNRGDEPASAYVCDIKPAET